MKKFLQEFKTFATRGNVIDLAVGVIIGSAFSAITNSLVNDILNPILGILTGSNEALSGLSFQLPGGGVLMLGSFINAVLNFLNLRVDVTDTEAGSATQGSVYSAYCSLRDASDPISVVVTSTTGDKIVNGTGSTTLKAELWRAGVEIDTDGTLYTYTWYKHKKDGTADTAWGTSGTKTGKTLTVAAADVDVKSTFVVEISKN